MNSLRNQLVFLVGMIQFGVLVFVSYQSYALYNAHYIKMKQQEVELNSYKLIRFWKKELKKYPNQGHLYEAFQESLVDMKELEKVCLSRPDGSIFSASETLTDFESQLMLNNWSEPHQKYEDLHAVEKEGLFYVTVLDHSLGSSLESPGLALWLLVWKPDTQSSLLVFQLNIFLALGAFLASIWAVSLWSKNALERPLKKVATSLDKVARGPVNVDSDGLGTSDFFGVLRETELNIQRIEEYQALLEQKTLALEEANQRFQKLNENLEEEVQGRIEELNEFFSIVTHDIRIPLAAVQGYAELLLNNESLELPDKARSLLEKLLLCDRQALDLVRQLLSAVKLRMGRDTKVANEVVDLSEVLKRAVEEVCLSQGYSVNRVCLTIEHDDFFTQGSQEKLYRVFTNLIDNALEHTEGDRPIEVNLYRKGTWNVIDIQDFGLGIDPDLKESVFTKFRQGDNARRTGLGLGLYIVYGLIAMHQGQIAIESTGPEGTLIRCLLPRWEETETDLVEREHND